MPIAIPLSDGDDVDVDDDGDAAFNDNYDDTDDDYNDSDDTDDGNIDDDYNDDNVLLQHPLTGNSTRIAHPSEHSHSFQIDILSLGSS